MTYFFLESLSAEPLEGTADYALVTEFSNNFFPETYDDAYSYETFIESDFAAVVRTDGNQALLGLFRFEVDIGDNAIEGFSFADFTNEILIVFTPVSFDETFFIDLADQYMNGATGSAAALDAYLADAFGALTTVDPTADDLVPNDNGESVILPASPLFDAGISFGGGEDHITADIRIKGVIDGGDDVDTIIVTQSVEGATGMTLDLGAGTATVDGAQLSFINFEAGKADTGHDTLYGSDADNILYGEAGNDILHDSAGANFLVAGDGDDTVYLVGDGVHDASLLAHNISSDTQTGTGAKALLTGMTQFHALSVGNDGFDTLHLTDAADALFLYDTLSRSFADFATEEGAGDDPVALRIANFERLDAGGGDDLIDLTSPFYTDMIDGLEVLGGAGNDTIWGSDVDETLQGGTGDDTLFGGAGSNILVGGAGADTFEFTRTSTADTLSDFSLADGDTLRFYNAGGALFDVETLSLTSTGFRIDYTDADTTDTATLRITLGDDVVDLNTQDLASILEIV